jgi:demethylmenaquinone methyltransferase/2-methoxy-6-polyprenyl-1,4-benzoquinol methylase
MLPPIASVAVILDIACGTGDITRRLNNAYPSARIIGCDLSVEMVRIAAKSTSPMKTIALSLQDMAHPAMRDGSVDLVTGGYALRNAPDPAATLRETARILKADGTAAFLDFSKSDVASIASLQCALLVFWGGLWGLILHGRPSVYAYLGRSLATYPDKKRLNRLFEEAGFVVQSTCSRMFGLIRIDVVQKKKASAFSPGAGANVRQGGKK